MDSRKIIYTSYIANAENLPPDLHPILISLKKVSGFSSYQKLAPKADDFKAYKRSDDFASFTVVYMSNVLNLLDPNIVVRDLYAITRLYNKSFPCLLCFEGKDQPCHRHIVAAWLQQHGYDSFEI